MYICAAPPNTAGMCWWIWVHSGCPSTSYDSQGHLPKNTHTDSQVTQTLRSYWRLHVLSYARCHYGHILSHTKIILCVPHHALICYIRGNWFAARHDHSQASFRSAVSAIFKWRRPFWSELIWCNHLSRAHGLQHNMVQMVFTLSHPAGRAEVFTNSDHISRRSIKRFTICIIGVDACWCLPSMM